MAETVTWSVNIEGVPGHGVLSGTGDSPTAAIADAKAKLTTAADAAAALAASVERAQAAVDSTDVALSPAPRLA